MPLDPRARRFLDMAGVASRTDAGRPPIDERRAALARLMTFARSDRATQNVRDRTMPGPGGSLLPYRLYSPSEPRTAILPGFVFFHGGGLVAGSLDTHDTICRALSEETGCRLVSVDYRLAPEHPFPAAVDDALAAVSWVSEEAASLGIDPKLLVIGGDSAGATLAVVACIAARDRGAPALALQCLICPVLDSVADSASRQEFASGYLIDRTVLSADLADYLRDGGDPHDPKVSPLRAENLAGLPPAIVVTAEYDPLRDEGDTYARRLAEQGVSVRHTRHEGMVHNFHALGAVLPQGREVLRQIGTDVREMLAVKMQA